MGLRIVFVLMFLCLGWAIGQEVRIGVVTAEGGAEAASGRAQAAAVKVQAALLAADAGRFGVPMELIHRDDGGSPERSLALVRRLVEEDRVHAVICCTGAAASDLVAAYLGESQVVMVSPSPLSDRGRAPIWTFSLLPRTTDLLAAIVGHAELAGARAIGLMTLDNDFGTRAEALLAQNLEVAGMTLAGQARYRPDVAVLTPEALWVATREPAAVVIWGLASDTELALAGLRARGYRGPVYARPQLLKPAPAGFDRSSLEGALFPVSPAELRGALRIDHPAKPASDRFWQQLERVYGEGRVGADAAPVFDAVDLLKRAVEQAVVYGVDPAAVTSYRQALRDALIGLPVMPGASGLFDFREDRTSAALPAGLVTAQFRAGSLHPANAAR